MLRNISNVRGVPYSCAHVLHIFEPARWYFSSPKIASAQSWTKTWRSDKLSMTSSSQNLGWFVTGDDTGMILPSSMGTTIIRSHSKDLCLLLMEEICFSSKKVVFLLLFTRFHISQVVGDGISEASKISPKKTIGWFGPKPWTNSWAMKNGPRVVPVVEKGDVLGMKCYPVI